MAKVALTNIYLVNWYGFINTKIPIGRDLTLITGENECGKSTILDAMKYAFTGDVEFNKSSSSQNVGGSRRTLSSYTRCLIDPSAGIYSRPAERMPNVYSHISLEYHDELNEDFFVLGVVLETNSSNNVSSYWYAAEHTSMEQMQYVYREEGVVKPYDYQGFQRAHRIPVMSQREAMVKFMNMTGLKLSSGEIRKFQRKLRSIMTYNPAAKIQQFIKESVLEAKDINFDKLRDAKNYIEKMNQTLELIKVELEALEGILRDFERYEAVKTRLIVDDGKQIYKNILRLKKSIGETQDQIAGKKGEIGHLEETIGEKEREKDRAETGLLKAKSNLNELDCSKAIEEEEENRRRLQAKLDGLEQARGELSAFQEQVKEMLRTLGSLGAETGDEEILTGLTLADFSYGEKKNASDRLKRALSAQRDGLTEQRVEIRGRLKTVQEELIHHKKVAEDCEKNRLDYSHVPEQAELIREINREFQNRNIPARAMFSCEYVVKVEDEEWRAVIETFLGIHRYSILVEPEWFDIADQVLDRSSHKYVELVNTRLLAGKKVKHYEDAVVNKLLIKNEIAQKYFDYWLGGIHAVPEEQVPRYENAMSRSGKLARNMAVTYINTRKNKTFCLGQEAIELNRKHAERQIQELEQQEQALGREQQQVQDGIQRITEQLDCFKAYDFDAFAKYDQTAGELNRSAEKLHELTEAQKNNLEYQTLFLQVQELEKQLEKVRKGLDQAKDRKRSLELENQSHETKLTQDRLALKDREERLEELRLLHGTETKMAMEEYDGFLAGISRTGDVMLPESRRKREGEKQSLEANILGGQKSYNMKKNQEDQLPEGLGQESRYLARKNKIWVDDLQEIHAKMAEQTRRYESIFKNEFVLSVYQTALGAREDIAGINKELRKLKFSTRYQFDVNLLDDKSDYAKILRYAEYLKKVNKVDDGQMVFASLYGYEEDEIEQREKEIREIINRIIDKNDMGAIQDFADYRNYMSYEIVINNADVKDGKLSRQAGYSSGAGTQIPYTLILSAALSMLYNARVNSTRLIFIDEPFEKMSDHNIKLMLEFFQNQDFQVIFCAPPNKTDSIGFACDTVIPVLKVRNDNMQIGSVEFHERKGAVHH